jgi:dUTP pyrophosphatase
MSHNCVRVQIVRLDHAQDFNFPEYATDQSAGLDLSAALDAPVILNPGERYLVPTGMSMALPEGYEAQVRPRSGLALKHGITVLNSPGTIDADYRGEIKAILINHGTEPFIIERGMRVAQLIVAPFSRVEWQEREGDMGDGRGGGFGSTGLSHAVSKN